MARIKEKTLVTLTVHRGVAPQDQQHLYDEILYSDSQLSQNLSQPDENMPLTPAYTGVRPRGRPALLVEENQRSPHPQSPHPQSPHLQSPHPRLPSSSGHRGGKPVHRVVLQQPPQGVEKGSKDSGLSSQGSSNHHNHHDNEEGRRPEPHHVRMGSQGSQESRGSQSSGSGHSRVEGNYEVEVRDREEG